MNIFDACLILHTRFTKIADIEDLKDLPDPLSKVTGGLIGSKGSTKIPLQGVHIRAKVVDMVAKVSFLKTLKFRIYSFSIFSTFANNALYTQYLYSEE